MNEVTQSEFNEIMMMVKDSQNKIYNYANQELIILYWNIGKYVSKKQGENEWGSKIIEKLSIFIKSELGDVKGFSKRNIEKMVRFYKAYHNKIASTVLTQLSWSHHNLILSKTKTLKERKFYIELCINEKYSIRELERQLNTNYYERYALGERNKTTSRLVLPDPLVFEFLALKNDYRERNIEDEMVREIKKLKLELGKDFILVDEQFPLSTQSKKYYIDLLFYNRKLNYYLVCEIKNTVFKPSYVGIMNLYIKLVDEQVKQKEDKPTIGLILCKNKDEIEVKYVLNKNMNDLLITQYVLDLVDKSVLEERLNKKSKI